MGRKGRTGPPLTIAYWKVPGPAVRPLGGCHAAPLGAGAGHSRCSSALPKPAASLPPGQAPLQGVGATQPAGRNSNCTECGGLLSPLVARRGAAVTTGRTRGCLAALLSGPCGLCAQVGRCPKGVGSNVMVVLHAEGGT